MNSPDSESALSPAKDPSAFAILFPFIEWMRHFLIGNPFFLLSAGFLLYGVNKFSVKPQFIAAEYIQLGFNFGILLVYELLLVVTAVFVARLKVWEDALLLVCLENLFLLVPFSLLSRASFLEWKLAAVIAAIGIIFAVAKFTVLRRFIPELNFTRRFFLLGITFVVINAILPVIFRNVDYHSIAAQRWLHFFWWAVLPGLTFLGNFLSSQDENGKEVTRYKWLTPVLFHIWIWVTAGHLAGLGFTEDFRWETAVVGPVLCAIAWNLRFQWSVSSSPKLRAISMALPLLTTWVALLNTSLFATLSGINACLYAVDFWRKQDRLALPCAFFSAAAVLASLPLGTMDWIWPDINRSRMIFAGISAYWLAVSLYSRNPWAAFPGAIVSMYLAGLSSSGSNFVVFRVIQTGLVFVLFHSLRWEETADKAVRHFRTTISVLWAINSIWWSGQDAGSLWFLTGTASVVLAFCCIIRWLTKDWPSKVVVLVAGLNLAMIFSIHGTRKVQSVSPDMWAIIAAFMLFVLGTGFAIAKHRWQRERKMN